MEFWKDLEGYDFKYQISNEGRVRNVDYRGTGKVRYFNPNYNSKGYPRVGLVKGGKQKHYSIHRLVAKSFVPNPNNKPHVNHLDEDKRNNRADNLDWVTNKENSNYGTKGKRIAASHNKLGTYKKLARMKSMPIIRVSLIGGERKRYKSLQSTTKDGFNPGCVSNVLKGRAKTHKDYIWEYA